MYGFCWSGRPKSWRGSALKETSGVAPCATTRLISPAVTASTESAVIPRCAGVHQRGQPISRMGSIADRTSGRPRGGRSSHEQRVLDLVARPSSRWANHRATLPEQSRSTHIRGLCEPQCSAGARVPRGAGDRARAPAPTNARPDFAGCPPRPREPRHSRSARRR